MTSHTHRVHKRKRAQLNKEILEILRTVPYEKGFHFYASSGNYIGETAMSLHDFELKIQVVPAVSVIFHMQRGDFQKWISDTLGDTELAKRISLIELTLPVEDLRKELLAIVQTRITALRMELPHYLRHTHA
jgi:hypothetical protein